MGAMTIDSAKLVRDLEAGGFSPDQARVLVETFGQAMAAHDLATKKDLQEAELRLQL